MCVVSMVMEHYTDKWTDKLWPEPKDTGPIPAIYIYPQLTEEEVTEFRKLLERAKKYDEENNQKDCELEEKKQILKDLAEKLGVKIDFL